MLDRLLKEGYLYLFVSNSDNLGATLDPALLSWFASSDMPFLMEVTVRTAADRKGDILPDAPVMVNFCSVNRRSVQRRISTPSRHPTASLF